MSRIQPSDSSMPDEGPGEDTDTDQGTDQDSDQDTDQDSDQDTDQDKDQDTDQDIIELLRAQDPTGLQRLLHTYGGKVRNNLRHELGGVLGANDLDEVLNRAAFLAWRHVATFDGDRGRLGSWFYIIARNAALSLVRDVRPPSGRKLIESIDLAAISSEEGIPLGHSQAATNSHASVEQEDHTPRSERQRRFMECFRLCVAQLSKRQQAIVKADLKAGSSADAGELAKRLNTTKESIYASRSVARKALRAAMRRHGYFGGDQEANPA